MSASLFYYPFVAMNNSRGLPAGAAKAYFYVSGTTTLATIYADSGGVQPLANPVEADAFGRLPAIYLDDAVVYRLRAVDINGTPIAPDVDPLTPGTFNAISLPGTNGINGAVGSSSGFSSLFSAASGMTIGTGITAIYMAGYSVEGKGAAWYVYDDTVDSAFVTAHPRWSFLAADGRGFRLDETQKLWIEMFGAAGDASTGVTGTDDYQAFAAAKDFQDHFRQFPSGNADYKPAPAVHLSNKGYRSSQVIILDRTANRFFGTGNNFNGTGASFIIFDSGQAGIVIQCWDNTGTDLTEIHTPHTYGTDPRGAQCAHLRDISLYSRGGTVGATDQNGVLVHTACILERVHCFDFGGNGIALRADAGSGTNANACQVISCGAQRCGLNGYYDQGGDVNAGQVLGFQAFNNRQFGIYAGNFLGQFYLFFQCDGNGTVTSGPSWATKNVSSYTNYGGHIYYVRPGEHEAASTTTPGTDASVWIDQGAGSTSLGGSWVTGQIFTSGGGFYAGGLDFSVNNNGRNVFAGYCESNQYAGWSDSSTSCSLPGFAQFVGGTGCILQASNSALVSAAIGYLGRAANGDLVTNLLGLDGGVDGAIRTFGRGASGETPWREICDISNNISYAFNGGAGTSPQNMLGSGGNHPYSMQFPNGHTSGGVFCTSGSAAPTAGTWARGDRIWNDGSVTALGTTDHWVCSVAGTPGTWIAKA